MNTIIYALIILIFMGGCGGNPSPEWTRASFNQLESYKKNYLRGNVPLAELSFRKAIEEIKTSGDIRIMEKTYLTKYAVQIASLETFDDSEYLRLAGVRQRLEYLNYYYFLKGSFAEVDLRELPVQYVRVFKASRDGNQREIDQEVSAIDDPLSRLVAAGLMVQKDQNSEFILSIAIQTASAQGWKKPLLAYLKKLHLYYNAKGDPKKSASIQQHIELINE